MPKNWMVWLDKLFPICLGIVVGLYLAWFCIVMSLLSYLTVVSIGAVSCWILYPNTMLNLFLKIREVLTGNYLVLDQAIMLILMTVNPLILMYCIWCEIFPNYQKN